MVKSISATRLRMSLFETLSEVQKGAVVLVERGGKVVARLVPAGGGDWRDAISEQPTLLVSPEEAFAPIEDLFDE